MSSTRCDEEMRGDLDLPTFVAPVQRRRRDVRDELVLRRFVVVLRGFGWQIVPVPGIRSTGATSQSAASGTPHRRSAVPAGTIAVVGLVTSTSTSR